MGFDKNIEVQAVAELKSILEHVCDREKVNCVKLLIQYYYTRHAYYTIPHFNIRSLSYELEFQMHIELAKLNVMTQHELDTTADLWFEKLVALDNFYS
jgi:hypothetical protein